MDREIELFISALSQIGSRDDSLYDTLIRDSIREVIVKQPLSKDLVVSDAIRLSNRKETESLYDALRFLLMAFERAAADETLESIIKQYVLSLAPISSQRIAVDEVFGDYFDETADGNRRLPAPIRNFFYSDICALAFMIVPALIVAVYMFSFYRHIDRSLFLLITMIASFIAACGGSSLHEYLNRKIQKYEGVGQQWST